MIVRAGGFRSNGVADVVVSRAKPAEMAWRIAVLGRTRLEMRYQFSVAASASHVRQDLKLHEEIAVA